MFTARKLGRLSVLVVGVTGVLTLCLGPALAAPTPVAPGKPTVTPTGKSTPTKPGSGKLTVSAQPPTSPTAPLVLVVTGVAPGVLAEAWAGVVNGHQPDAWWSGPADAKGRIVFRLTNSRGWLADTRYLWAVSLEDGTREEGSFRTGSFGSPGASRPTPSRTPSRAPSPATAGGGLAKTGA